VIVTNTNNSVNGTKTATVTGSTATITVAELVNAAMPIINAQPVGANYVQNAAATALSVTATISDSGSGGALSYQWYSNTANSNSGGNALTGETNASYTPRTATPGTVYYYVIVTNTNNSVNGTQTATVTSDTAAIAITNQKVVSVTGVPVFNLRLVPATPAGGFQRDSTATNKAAITNGYWMAETEVTQELFQAVMGANPSSFTGSPASVETQAKRPVEYVNWYAAIAFCNKLSLKDGKTPVYSVSGISDWAALAYSSIPTSSNTTWNAATRNTGANGYRLPTEMEWMWAAMGATAGGATVTTTGYDKAFAGSDGANGIGDCAWYKVNADNKTHEVGKKIDNELGLYDMTGNVWEWCWDWYASSYPAGAESDYTGAISGSSRVGRGGSYLNPSGSARCTVAYRAVSSLYGRQSYLGLRVVRAQ
jgi:formylglycine-generating enzyme required for sulfatase activity